MHLGGLVLLAPATEPRLEELIEAEPAILGEPLLIIGRRVATSFGKVIDLLAVDAEGVLHVLELKKDRTPRDVVAQVLEYGAWVLR
jgi:RecB family endonuclease NucS